MEQRIRIAYFSMEIALESELPTYSGGLGVLAGDTLRSCADLGLPVVGVTLVHRKGYFRQQLSKDGEQQALSAEWDPAGRLNPVAPHIEVRVGGDPVRVRAWRYTIVGNRGGEVPVFLLDTGLPENPAPHRAITDTLYGGDDGYRLAQEVVLGVGGVKLLRALGYQQLERFHLNEGHAALAVPQLVTEVMETNGGDLGAAAERVRETCVFTTHTPVPAGHDRFETALARKVLGKPLWDRIVALGATHHLNMTALALEHARFVNGVAMRHGEVSRDMFPGYPIRSITNGVHPATWVSPPFAALYDRHLEHWKEDPFSLRCVTAIDKKEIAAAHQGAKKSLLDTVRDLSGRRLDPAALTLGFARRATAYKRPLLVLHDPERLEQIAREVGPLQLVFAGKAHPQDDEGLRLLREVHRHARQAPPGVTIVFLPGYEMALGRTLAAGCDLWLNTPVPPLEASGTSGMKAALNGVPSLSVLDGWWVEGCVEGVTGWGIGGNGDAPEPDAGARDRQHAAALYDKLAGTVAPLFYRDAPGYQEVMRQSIAVNGAYFHSHRMVLQYLFEAYGGTRGAGGVPIWDSPGSG